MKRILSILTAALLLTALLAGCTAGNTETSEPANESAPSADKVFKVGICQFVQHPALDAATNGFIEALSEKLGDKVVFDNQNANEEINNCATICNQFVANKVDLILANATPALQAAAAATNTIPILGTSITDYATALEAKEWNGASGRNISGTSDLAPLTQQADMLMELFPDAKKVGIIFCSSEANSFYQANVVTEYLTGKGLTCKSFTYSDSNDVAQIVANAWNESDVLYVPTDNKSAANTSVINETAMAAKKAIIAGEEGICKGCGVATLSISYHDIGYEAGLMAYEILANGADVSTMQIKFAPEVTKMYNKTICEKLGITPPEGYTAIEE